MRVVSAFDGAAMGRLALLRAGIAVDEYISLEIDKHAIKVADSNWSDLTRMGDVCGFSPKAGEYDLLIGGSPCQSFSRSGDGSGFDGKSKLFWEYVRILREGNFKYFLLENVVMKKEWEKVITEALGVDPIMIDSCLVSAQKRQRLYWTNIPNVSQPEDRFLRLVDLPDRRRDILTDHPLVVGRGLGAGLKIRNATKRGYLWAEHGDSINLEVPNSKTRRGRVGKGKTNTLNTACNYAVNIGGIMEKLTVEDCELLQTLPVGYTQGVSESQRRKIIGNGWTVDVIAHIFSGLKL